MLVLLLPNENAAILRRLLNMLHEVSLHQEENKMNAMNLGIVLAPHILCPRKVRTWRLLHFVSICYNLCIMQSTDVSRRLDHECIFPCTYRVVHDWTCQSTLQLPPRVCFRCKASIQERHGRRRFIEHFFNPTGENNYYVCRPVTESLVCLTFLLISQII